MENNDVASQVSSQLESAVHPIRQAPELDSALGGSISKNAQKRLMKAQKREQQKVERRAREKVAKAAKKEAKRKRGEEDEDRSSKKRKFDDGALEEGDEMKDHTVQKQQPRERIPFGSKIVIDLGFDDKMTERVRISSSKLYGETNERAVFKCRSQEIVSLVSQCAYSYSSNRKASTPFSALLFTSLNGRTKARLDMLATYQNWRGVEWWEQDYDQLWTLDGTEEQLDLSDENKNQITRTFTCPVTSMLRHRTKSAKEKVVYLTADSDVELLELNPEETYVIGGIVDKNRYKVCLL
jgi:tRNA (guanine9-N1)-methyltransferase